MTSTCDAAVSQQQDGLKGLAVFCEPDRQTHIIMIPYTRSV